MAWVDHHGARLYLEHAGRGPRLLFITGTGADLRLKPSPFDSPLARSFELASYDQRGLGQSDRPAGPYTMAGYADDAAAILDALGWETVSVMGVSFGGMVAQELVLAHPERVSQLILCCTSSGGAGGSSYPLHELTGLAVEERVSLMTGLTDSRWAEPASSSSPDVVRQAMAQRWRAAPPADAGALSQLEARTHHDTWDRLPSLHCPLLVCAGRYDGVAPLANSEALAGRVPGAQLAVFEGGHGFLYQDPTAFPRITSFLEASAGA